MFSEAFEIMTNPHTIPMLVGAVSAGKPRHTSATIEKIDLYDLLCGGSDNCILLKIDGESMADMNIHSGDYVIMNRGQQPRAGDTVIAELNGEHTIKKWEPPGYNGRRGLYLVPKNRNYKPREITPKDECIVLGVVLKIIKSPS